jgi:hypothetical protein
LGIGNWELEIGNWKLGIGNWSPILSIQSIKNHFISRSNSKKTDCDSRGCGKWVESDDLTDSDWQQCRIIEELVVAIGLPD